LSTEKLIGKAINILDACIEVFYKDCAGYFTHTPEKRVIRDMKPRNSYDEVTLRNAGALIIPDPFMGKADECPYPNQSLLIHLTAYQNKKIMI
jgi:hypothetical protein